MRRFGMLRDRKNIVLARRCTEARGIDGDQTKMLNERRVVKRHKSQAAVRKGMDTEKRFGQRVDRQS